MAAPLVVQSRVTTAKSTSVNVSYPSGMTSGNRVIVALGWVDNAAPVSYTGSALTYIGGIDNDENNRANFYAYYRDIDGTEGSSENFDFDEDRECTAIVVEVSGQDTAVAPLAAFATTGGSRTNNPDPPSRAWGWSGDTLALAGFVFREDSTVSGQPSGYSQINSGDISGKALHVISEKDVTSSPENPGTFSCSDSRNTTTYTLVIKSAGTSDDLTADNVESASETTAPEIGQTHVLTATSVEAASQTSSPSVGQTHALTAESVESASEVTAPAISEVHALTANSVEAASETTAPDIGQVHALTSANVEAASETSAPEIGQTHALTADDVESASEVTAPSLGSDSTDELTADNVEAASEVTSPAVGQTHAITAVSVEAASETTSPSIGQAHALTAGDVEATSELTAPTVGTTSTISAAASTAAITTTTARASLILLGGANITLSVIVTARATRLWEDQADTSETWTEQSDTAETWTGQGDTDEVWNEQSKTTEVWGVQAKTTEIWSEVA
ncbi:ribonuclease E [Octadecabacter Antarctic DB virus 2]|nr:ribonuclease E [Octadecabacter Antarctic DB virus 2]